MADPMKDDLVGASVTANPDGTFTVHDTRTVAQTVLTAEALKARTNTGTGSHEGEGG